MDISKGKINQSEKTSGSSALCTTFVYSFFCKKTKTVIYLYPYKHRDVNVNKNIQNALFFCFLFDDSFFFVLLSINCKQNCRKEMESSYFENGFCWLSIQTYRISQITNTRMDIFSQNLKSRF